MAKSQALKKLEQDAHRLKCERLPTLSEHGKQHIPMPKFSDKNANELQKAIIAWYYVRGGYAMRINVGGTYDQNLGRFRHSGSTKGVSDIIGIVDGHVHFVEVKHGRDKQSEDQVKFEQNVKRAGGVYFIARNFDQFEKIATLALRV